MRPAHAAQCESRRKRDRARRWRNLMRAGRPICLQVLLVGAWMRKPSPLQKEGGGSCRGRRGDRPLGLFVVLDLLVQAVLLGVEMRLLPGRDVAAVDVLVGAFLIVDRGFLVLELVVVAVEVAVVGIEPVVDVVQAVEHFRAAGMIVVEACFAGLRAEARGERAGNKTEGDGEFAGAGRHGDLLWVLSLSNVCRSCEPSRKFKNSPCGAPHSTNVCRPS